MAWWQWALVIAGAWGAVSALVAGVIGIAVNGWRRGQSAIAEDSSSDSADVTDASQSTPNNTNTGQDSVTMIAPSREAAITTIVCHASTSPSHQPSASQSIRSG
jgi:hypothetical protein